MRLAAQSPTTDNEATSRLPWPIREGWRALRSRRGDHASNAAGRHGVSDSSAFWLPRHCATLSEEVALAHPSPLCPVSTQSATSPPSTALSHPTSHDTIPTQPTDTTPRHPTPPCPAAHHTRRGKATQCRLLSAPRRIGAALCAAAGPPTSPPLRLQRIARIAAGEGAGRPGSLPIQSYPVPSRPIPSHPVPSRPTPSRPVLSHPVPSYLVPFRPVPILAHPCPAFPSYTIPSRSTLYQPTPYYPILSHPANLLPSRLVPSRPTPTRPRPHPTPPRSTPSHSIPTYSNPSRQDQSPTARKVLLLDWWVLTNSSESADRFGAMSEVAGDGMEGWGGGKG